MADFSEFLLSEQPTTQFNDSTDDLVVAWRTEANTPEILPYKADLVSQIQGILVDQQVCYIESLKESLFI